MHPRPLVVKTKMGFRSGGIVLEIVNKQLKTEKNPPLLKHILALPMVGQISMPIARVTAI